MLRLQRVLTQELHWNGFMVSSLAETLHKVGQQNLTCLHCSVLPTAVLTSKPDCMDGAKGSELPFCARTYC